MLGNLVKVTHTSLEVSDNKGIFDHLYVYILCKPPLYSVIYRLNDWLSSHQQKGIGASFFLGGGKRECEKLHFLFRPFLADRERHQNKCNDSFWL